MDFKVLTWNTLRATFNLFGLFNRSTLFLVIWVQITWVRSQELIYSAINKSFTRNNMDDENVPCHLHCYLQLEGNSGITPSVRSQNEQTTTLQSATVTGYETWRALEKSLFYKGVKISSKNRARVQLVLFMLQMTKTCLNIGWNTISPRFVFSIQVSRVC